MRIYGAGLAGLLAATMLRRHKPIICEAQTSLPNNHDALLRFRTDAVSKATGIPFKKVNVQKAVFYEGSLRISSDLRLCNMYSEKATGQIGDRSIINLAPVERYIAPPNFVSLLADGLDIRYQTPLLEPLEPQEDPVISTIPMPFLMKIARWPERPEFNYRTITTVTCDIVEPKTEVYQTIYYPGRDFYYRSSITGNHLIIEMVGDYVNMHSSNKETLVEEVAGNFGIDLRQYTPPELKVQRFGKITAIAEEPRKEFILAMSDRFRVYSLGRYATWRNILLDELVNDTNIIERFVTQRSGYNKRLDLSFERYGLNQ